MLSAAILCSLLIKRAMRLQPDKSQEQPIDAGLNITSPSSSETTLRIDFRLDLVVLKLIDIDGKAY